jgi:probable rRNA maturation factor
MAVSVFVQNVSGTQGVPADEELRSWIGAVFADRPRGEVGVRVVDEDEARSLNRQYRSRDYATNVLAFPGDDELDVAGAETPLGDIVICATVLEREAREQQRDLRAYWAHIVIHGALHLDGYDHETDEQARTMEAKEALLLAWFGFPNPWESLAQDTAPLHHSS